MEEHASAGSLSPHFPDDGRQMPAAGPPMREATTLLRDLIDVNDEFALALRAALSVNGTDLDAMEHLLMSGPLGPSELSRRLGISTASTTTAVDRLVDLGHVTRERHPTDRRSVIISPTPSSRAKAMGLLMPMLVDMDALLDALTPAEQAVVTEYMRGIIRVYRAHVERVAQVAAAS